MRLERKETNMDKEDIKQKNKQVAEMFDSLGPFTITVTNGHDAAWLSCACMQYLCNGKADLTEEVFVKLMRACEDVGAEEAVSMFFDEGRKLNNQFPAFMQPMFILMFDHAIKKLKEREAEKEEDNE